MITPRAELSFSVPGSYSRRNSDLDVEDELSSYVRVPSRRGSSSRTLMQPSTAPCRSPVSMNLPPSLSVRTIEPTHRLASPLAESRLSQYEASRLSRAEFTPTLREQLLQPSVKIDSEISRHSFSISRDPRFIVSPADDSMALIGTGITVADMEEAQNLKSPMVTKRALPTIQPSWSGSPLLKAQASYSANPSGEMPLSNDGEDLDAGPMRPQAAPNSLEAGGALGRSIVVRFSQGADRPRKSPNEHPHRSRSVPPDRARGFRLRHANERKPSFSREEVPDALESRRSSLTAQLAAKRAQVYGQRSRSAPPCKDRGTGKQVRSRSAVKPFRVLEAHDKILQLRVLLPEFAAEGLVVEKVELKGPIAGEDLIARIISTWNAKSNFFKSWKPLKSSRPVDYELRIVDEDDDEIDEDFPPLQRTKDVHSFNLQYIGMCFRRRRSVSVPEQRPSQTVFEDMEASCQSPNTRRRRLISDSALCCFVTVDIPNVEVQHLHIDQRDTMNDVLDRINQRSTEQFYEHGHFEFYYRHDPSEALSYDVTVHDLVTHDVLLLPRRDFSRHREHSLPRDHLLARRYEEFNISDLSDPSLARGPNTRTIGFNDQQILCCHQKVVSNATVLTPNFTYVWHRRGTSEEKLKRKHRWIMTQTLRQQQARRWSVRRVETWIRTVQGGRFAYYADTVKHLQIDGRALLELTESDLERTLRIEEPEDMQALFQYIQHLNPEVELDDTLTETFHTTPIQCLRSITQCPSIHDIFELEFELEGGARHTATYQAVSVTDCEKIVSRIASLLQLERAREMELSAMEEVRSEPRAGTSYRRPTAADPFSPPDDRRLQGGAGWR